MTLERMRADSAGRKMAVSFEACRWAGRGESKVLEGQLGVCRSAGSVEHSFVLVLDTWEQVLGIGRLVEELVGFPVGTMKV